MLEPYNKEEHYLDYVQRQIKNIIKFCKDKNTKLALKELNKFLDEK